MACKKCLKSNNVTKPPIAPGISVTERLGITQVITPFTNKKNS